MNHLAVVTGSAAADDDDFLSDLAQMLRSMKELDRLPEEQRAAHVTQIMRSWANRVEQHHAARTQLDDTPSEQELAEAYSFLRTPEGRKALTEAAVIAFKTNSRLQQANTLGEGLAAAEQAHREMAELHRDAGGAIPQDIDAPGVAPQLSDATRSQLLSREIGTLRRSSSITGRADFRGDVTNYGVFSPRRGEELPGSQSLGESVSPFRIFGRYTHQYDASLEFRPSEHTHWNQQNNQGRPRLRAYPEVHVVGRAVFAAPPHYGTRGTLHELQNALDQDRVIASTALNLKTETSELLQAGDVHRIMFADRGIEGRPARFAPTLRNQDPALFYGLDIWHPRSRVDDSWIPLWAPPGPLREVVEQHNSVPDTAMVMDLLVLRTPRRLIVAPDDRIVDLPLDRQAAGGRRKLAANLVLVTHGTNASMGDIPLQGLAEGQATGLAAVADEMARFASARGLSERWDVATFDWREFAGGSDDRRGGRLIVTGGDVLLSFEVAAMLVTLGKTAAITRAGWAATSEALKQEAVKYLIEHAISEAGRDAVERGLRDLGVSLDTALFQQGFSPWESARIGRQIGFSLADWLLDSGVDHSELRQIHLLSHSSGSWLIDGFARRVEERRLDFGPQGPPALHLTFFDMFVWPEHRIWHATQFPQPGLGPLSNSAAVTEQYVDRRVPGTDGLHPHGYNVELIWLDPSIILRGMGKEWSNRTGQAIPRTDERASPLPHEHGDVREHLLQTRFAHPQALFSAIGDPFSLVAAHAWPYEWYRATVRLAAGKSAPAASIWCPDQAWRAWGFVLSPLYRDSISPHERAHINARVTKLMTDKKYHLLPEYGDCRH
jgi:hypothetical protein